HVRFLEHSLLQTTDALSSAGVRQLLLKGPAHAYLDYAQPGDRVYGDIDLLVCKTEFVTAITVLQCSGYTALTDARGSGIAFEAEFDKARTLTSPDGAIIDLHHFLADPPYGLAIDTSLLFRQAEPFFVGDRQVHGLGREERLLHSCLHAVIGGLPPHL